MSNLNYKLIILVIVVVAFLAGILFNANTKTEVAKQQEIAQNLDTQTQSEFTSSPNLSYSKLDCKPKTKVFYDGKNFDNEVGQVGLIVDFANRKYSRYDAKGQDDYLAEFNTSGIYTNIQSSTPNGVMIKIQTDKMLLNDDTGLLDYLEVATLGLGSFITYGKCEVIN